MKKLAGRLNQIIKLTELGAILPANLKNDIGRRAFLIANLTSKLIQNNCTNNLPTPPLGGREGGGQAGRNGRPTMK